MRGIAAKQVTEVTQMPAYTINGATYNVESKAEWIDDATGGTDSCSNSGSKASYIRMTTTVRASNLANPVVVSSLVEPPISNADAARATSPCRSTTATATRPGRRRARGRPDDR